MKLILAWIIAVVVGLGGFSTFNFLMYLDGGWPLIGAVWGAVGGMVVATLLVCWAVGTILDGRDT